MATAFWHFASAPLRESSAFALSIPSIGSFVAARSGYNGGQMLPTQDLHVKQIVRLSTPRVLKAALPTPDAANATVVGGRQAIEDILAQRDPRLLASSSLLPPGPVPNTRLSVRVARVWSNDIVTRASWPQSQLLDVILPPMALHHRTCGPSCPGLVGAAPRLAEGPDPPGASST